VQTVFAQAVCASGLHGLLLNTRADLHPSVSTVESKVTAERNKSDIMTKLSKVAYKTILLSSVIMLENNRKKSKRTKWTKGWLLKRENFSHVNLLKELKFEKNDWFNYLRMDENCYLKLLQHITPLIKRQDTVMRKSISPHERLTVTLRFLATGRSYEDMKFSTAISPASLSIIIPETCRAIYEVLRNEYLKVIKKIVLYLY